MEKYVKAILLGVLWLLPVAAFPESSAVCEGGLREDSILPAYHLRTPDAAVMESYREDAAFNYKQEKSELPGWLQNLLDWLVEHLFRMRYSAAEPVSVWDILLKVSVVILTVFLIYKLVRTKYRLPFNLNEKRFTAEEADGPLESVDVVSYPVLLEKALAGKDYNLAVRVHYLYVLYLLDQKGIITRNKYKTNIAYIYEIGDRRLKAGFSELSRIFDYVCYGEFAVSEAVFLRVEKEFKAFQKEISNEV